MESQKNPKRITAKQKLRLTFLFAGIMCAGLLFFSIYTPGLRNSGKTGPTNGPSVPPTQGPSSTDTPTPTPTSTPTPTPTPIIPLEQNDDEELADIVERYFNAKLSGSKEDLLGIVSDYDSIDYDYIERANEKVENYSNFKIHKVVGREGSELDYILFVNFDLKILTIDAPIPHLSRLVVVQGDPDENGKTHPVLLSGSLNDIQGAFVSEIMEHEDVNQLINETKQRLLDVANVIGNEKLMELLEKLDKIDKTSEPVPES